VPDKSLRAEALAIWQAAVDAVRPEELLRAAFADPGLGLREAVATARHVIVVGAGKAGAAMSAGVEEILADQLEKIEGTVNVPAESLRPLQAIRLHAARPAGTNQPTAEGVVGSRQILQLIGKAGPKDVAFCLLSGGGSALLPLPVDAITLEDKQQVTLFLHRSGATINEMNAVRKHLSQIKGGRLAQAFHGRTLFSLIISDVVGDPLDVIASGPTAPDPTTFADALAVLHKYGERAGGLPACGLPTRVLQYLEQGAAGKHAETPKSLPASVHNAIIGNNNRALAAAALPAERLGYRVLNLGSFIEGETREVAVAFAGLVRSIQRDRVPLSPPVCLLSGGETTVTLGSEPGRGGRNQEFVLSAIAKLGSEGLEGVTVLSGGTDGEDGPTDAAGAVADQETFLLAAQQGLEPGSFLSCHEAYSLFERAGGLIKTGLTHTNVMDVRVILIL
jgi:hydroxypyruvate reductase/glycerate 2-kinase